MIFWKNEEQELRACDLIKKIMQMFNTHEIGKNDIPDDAWIISFKIRNWNSILMSDGLFLLFCHNEK